MGNFHISGNTNIRKRKQAATYLSVFKEKKQAKVILKAWETVQPQNTSVQSDYVDCLALNKPLI